MYDPDNPIATLLIFRETLEIWAIAEANDSIGLHYAQQDTPPKEDGYTGERTGTTGCGDELPPGTREE